MALDEQIIVIVLLPLLAATITGLCVQRMAAKYAQFFTCGALICAALLSTSVFTQVVFNDAVTTVQLAPWIISGDFVINWALRVDPLTAVMLVVVTWVSMVVHLYSVGYMSHDPHRTRFMCYLSLFTFAMLMLVTADNFIQLFFGWEGVGLCSYLLIGFWFHKDSANAASMKAFIVNRVGDLGLALGVMATFLAFGSVQFDTVFTEAKALADNSFTFLGFTVPLMDCICMLLFIGAMGKSAQLFLHTWLPDAMEGPTPVSALIHAATMVTAGVFLVARCSPMFELAPTALMVVTIVGATTAIFAATVGMVQNDIKRVIAYSTCSQLGYMFFACGVSAYSAGVFHLMTHAFFKALLFLGAGSVIHAMSDEQDMRNMGGIWKKIPYTYAYMWIGSLALAGIPWFAGFYSKDLILEAAYADHTSYGFYAFWMGIAAAFLTSFYSWRLLFMTFHGRSRASKEVLDHVHESPPIMMVPLALLAAGALFAGIIGYKSFGMVDADGAFWKGSIVMEAANNPPSHGHHGEYAGHNEVKDESHAEDMHYGDAEHADTYTYFPEHNILEAAHHVPMWVIILPILIAASGIAVAYLMYVRSPKLPENIKNTVSPVYRFLLNKWYFDELYAAIFIKPALLKGQFFWKWGDQKTIDGLGPDGVAALAARGAEVARKTQTGFLYHYAFVMLIGLLVIISFVFYTLRDGVL